MKQFYLNFLLVTLAVLSLTACNPKYRFITKGLRETDSSYVINKAGERIDAAEVVVRRNTLTVDGKVMKLNGLSAIKSKKMYFVVNDGELYFGEIYGKINLLYKVAYTSIYTGNSFGGNTMGGMPAYGGSGYSYGASKVYYLQKRGSADIDKMNQAVLIDYVSDNAEALQKAKASKLWQYGSYAGLAGFGTGVIWSAVSMLKAKEGESAKLGTPLLIAGIALPLYIVAAYTANHKTKKAIYIYNGQQ